MDLVMNISSTLTLPIGVAMPRKAIEAVAWRQFGRGPLGYGDLWKSSTGATGPVSIDDGEWHISVSHSDRYPTWDELAGIRDAATPPGVAFVMHFPTPAEYVNLHQTCLHLWGATA